MKLEKAFAREVSKVANGDGSREAKFAFAKKVRETREKLSTPEVSKNTGGFPSQFASPQQS